jgi:hypothetical protein
MSEPLFVNHFFVLPITAGPGGRFTPVPISAPRLPPIASLTAILALVAYVTVLGVVLDLPPQSALRTIANQNLRLQHSGRASRTSHQAPSSSRGTRRRPCALLARWYLDILNHLVLLQVAIGSSQPAVRKVLSASTRSGPANACRLSLPPEILFWVTSPQ